MTNILPVQQLTRALKKPNYPIERYDILIGYPLQVVSNYDTPTIPILQASINELHPMSEYLCNAPVAQKSLATITKINRVEGDIFEDGMNRFFVELKGIDGSTGDTWMNFLQIEKLLNRAESELAEQYEMN